MLGRAAHTALPAVCCDLSWDNPGLAMGVALRTHGETHTNQGVRFTWRLAWGQPLGSAQPTGGCAGLREMNQADGGGDRSDDRARALRDCVIDRKSQVGDWPGTAGAAEHAVFVVRRASGMVVVRSMREQRGGQALPADLEREWLCRHEPRRNERTQGKADQRDAGKQCLPGTLAGAQA